ncbi:hypothetical protein [Lentilactobacillus hilgardii]|uniref:hypothetical protein n=1 Tax=Lentilactobacillus hilgardii TaxID=1588 RepID=UPI0021A7CD1B|nr:hypothetical protein [Lentilactobacillus hilgardii]MCT3399377.1 hypothetical protein [Lentilactobacillus hilgardii]
MGLILFLMFGWMYLLFRIGFSLLRFFGGFIGLILIFFILTKVIIWGFCLTGVAALAFFGWLAYRFISSRV